MKRLIASVFCFVFCQKSSSKNLSGKIKNPLFPALPQMLRLEQDIFNANPEDILNAVHKDSQLNTNSKDKPSEGKN